MLKTNPQASRFARGAADGREGTRELHLRIFQKNKNKKEKLKFRRCFKRMEKTMFPSFGHWIFFRTPAK